MLKRRWFRIALYTLAGIIFLCGVILFFNRSIIAWIAEDYFSRQGASVIVDVVRLNSRGATLKLVAGPGEAPDASADRIDIVFGPGKYGRRVEAVTLTGAYMHVRYDGNRITFGSLTDFVEKMLKEPAGDSDFVVKDLPITLKSLRVRVTTQGGVIDLVGKGSLRGGQIQFVELSGTNGRIGLYGYGYGYRADVRQIELEISGSNGLYITGRLDAAVTGNINLTSLQLSFATNLVAAGTKISLKDLRLLAGVQMREAEAGKLASGIPYWSADAENHAALKKAL